MKTYLVSGGIAPRILNLDHVYKGSLFKPIPNQFSSFHTLLTYLLTYLPHGVGYYLKS